MRLRKIARGIAAGLLLALSLLPSSIPLRAENRRQPTGYVTDEARLLNQQTRESLESVLADLEQKTSAQVAVVTVPSLDGRDVSEFAADLFKRWGIGKKGKDNGVLFLIAPNERKMRIEVGYGLEGLIPDSVAGRIMDEQVLPYFKGGEPNSGVLMGTISIAQTIARDAHVTLSEPALPQESRPLRARGGFAQNLFSFIIFIVFLIAVIRHPWLLLLFLGGRGGGWSGGGFGGDGFGGFGGGSSGGGGASRGW